MRECLWDLPAFSDRLGIAGIPIDIEYVRAIWNSFLFVEMLYHTSYTHTSILMNINVHILRRPPRLFQICLGLVDIVFLLLL
jgi:hypothetical protein